MENPEEILHSLEEFSKLRPKSIPRELEEYLCFVAKTGDPVYQWSVIKYLFREKLINVITEFYESCPSVSIPSCRNVDIFNYDTMKTFILEKLDTFVAAPFTVQRICELLTTPRKEYNRIDKYMRALEKNINVVSTTEPGNIRTPENGDGFINGIESDHVQDGSHDINIEEMDDAPIWPTKSEDSYQSTSKEDPSIVESMYSVSDNNIEPEAATSQTLETVICSPNEEQTFVPIAINTDSEGSSVQTVCSDEKLETDLEVAKEESSEIVPAIVQRRRTSIEPPSDETDDLQQCLPIQETIEPGCSETDLLLDKPEISLQLPDNEHLPQDSNTPKQETPTDEPRDDQIPETILDVAGSGDGLHDVIDPPSDNENIELSEHVEIDVTSFGNTKPEDLPLSVELAAESSQINQEPALPVHEQVYDQDKVHTHEEEQHQEDTQIILPQAETPIDIPPLSESQELPDLPETTNEDALESSEPIAMETPTENTLESTTDVPLSPSLPAEVIEPQEAVAVEALELAENSLRSISNEQKALETIDQPDLTPEIIDDPLPAVDSTTDTAMEVDTAEAPCVETPPTVFADSNN